MGVSKNSGTPKWMVYNGKYPQNSKPLGTILTCISINQYLKWIQLLLISTWNPKANHL